MQSYQIIILALSFSYLWVDVMKMGYVKPFNCFKCMSGWFALIIGCSCIGWHGIIYLPVGLFAGCIYSCVKMRYL